MLSGTADLVTVCVANWICVCLLLPSSCPPFFVALPTVVSSKINAEMTSDDIYFALPSDPQDYFDSVCKLTVDFYPSVQSSHSFFLKYHKYL